MHLKKSSKLTHLLLATSLAATLAVGCSSSDESDPVTATTDSNTPLSISDIMGPTYALPCVDSKRATIQFTSSTAGMYTETSHSTSDCSDDPTGTLSNLVMLALSNVQVVSDNTTDTNAWLSGADLTGQGLTTGDQGAFTHTLITFDATDGYGGSGGTPPCTSCEVYAYAVDSILGSGVPALALTPLSATASASDNSTFYLGGQ